MLCKGEMGEDDGTERKENGKEERNGAVPSSVKKTYGVVPNKEAIGMCGDGWNGAK